MSVEALTVIAIVEKGNTALRKLYANGVNAQDFPVYEEEFEWIEQRLGARKPLNRRIFRQRFPEFEWLGVPKESVEDLAHSLREERVLADLNALMSTISTDLRQDNAMDLALMAREQINLITRNANVASDSLLEDYTNDIAAIKVRQRENKKGHKTYLQTGFPHLDHHWGGLLPGQFIEILGRTGEGKSYKTYAMALEAKLQNAQVGIFTPELSRHEVKCRIHTLASARPAIQKALGLKHSFRNRALMFDYGYNIKSYERFCQYFAEELPGQLWLLSGTHRPDQMTVGYIEDRIVSLGLDLVIVDPIYMLKPVRSHRDGNSYQEIAWTAEALQKLAEQYSIPIVFTNQSHLEGGAKDDAPAKERSFGAKALAHLSDCILGVKHMSEENRMICRCTKSRFGQNSFRYEVDLFANTGVIREKTPIVGSYFNGKDDGNDEDAIRTVIASVTDEEDM